MDMRKFINMVVEAELHYGPLLPNPTAARKSICGPLIGKGGERDVYEHISDPDLVVKIDREAVENGYDRSEQNMNEFQVWQRMAPRSTMAQWFAPCVQRSADYLVITQRKAPEPATAADFNGLMLPRLFTDEFTSYDLDLDHLEAWGILDGRPVLRDYGLLTVFMLENYPQELQPVSVRIEDGRIYEEEPDPHALNDEMDDEWDF